MHSESLYIDHTSQPPPPDEHSQMYTLFPLQTQHHPPITIAPNINSHDLSMELDIGAAVSMINESTSKTILSQQPPLEKSYTLTLESSSLFLESCKLLCIIMSRQLPYR